jgi:lysylphosphatidylglycerol synthetase-like protein (DUF2156 family)
VTNETRKLQLIQVQVKETEKKKKGVDFLTFILMLATVVFAILSWLDWSLITLLLTTIGLSASNTLGTRLQILESDKLQNHLDSIIDDD